MHEIQLTRLKAGSDYTLGAIEVAGTTLCTLEPAWRENRSGQSCIPPGRYPCTWRKSPKYGFTYWLRDTEPRTFVLIHPGNTSRHTRGCILLGFRQGLLNGQTAVLNSRKAVRFFTDQLERQPFTLTINEVAHGIH